MFLCLLKFYKLVKTPFGCEVRGKHKRASLPSLHYGTVDSKNIYLYKKKKTVEVTFKTWKIPFKESPSWKRKYVLWLSTFLFSLSFFFSLYCVFRRREGERWKKEYSWIHFPSFPWIIDLPHCFRSQRRLCY